MTLKTRTLVNVSKKRRKSLMKLTVHTQSPGGSTGSSHLTNSRPRVPKIAPRFPGSTRTVTSESLVGARVAQSDGMAFVPVKISRPQLLPPVLCSRRFYMYLVLFLLIVLVILVARLLSQIKVTFVHLHMESDTDLERVTLPRSFSDPRGAFCLDGSPPAYYIRPSPVISVNYWVVYLPGGAWCTSPQDCYDRSLRTKGSSSVAETSKSYNGILSTDCQVNPDFCLWNVVAFLYCDGGSFLGNSSKTVNHNGHELYLRGAVIFDTLIEYLSMATHFSNAQQIVLAGSSAGGIGALIHVDRLRSMLPSTVQTLHVVVDGSMFVDTPDINGEHTMAQIFQDTYSLHALNASAPVQECRQTLTPDTEWRCLFPGVYHRFVFTPMFFTNSIYDTWQRRKVVKILCSASECPSQNLDTLYQNRDAVRALAQEISTSSKKNGVFLTWCPAHSMTIRPWLTWTTLGSPSLQATLTAWLMHDETMNGSDVLLDLQSAVEQCQSVINI